MIDHLELRNFKCFREQTIPFRGLTILAGLNGSGKSSVIQAILALRQALGAERGTPWQGSLVNLGSYRDVIHEDASDDTVGLKVSFGGEAQARFEMRQQGEAGEAWCGPEAEKQLRGYLFYVSADRLGPRATLPFAGDGQRSSLAPLGKRGEHVLWYLHNFGGAPVMAAVRHPGESKNTLVAQATAWLGAISPGADPMIAVVPEADCAVVTYRFSRSGDVPSRPFRASNVGFGVSYAFPPIVALLAPKRDRTSSVEHLVIIENPEAHLHPGGQTSLAELAARATASGSQVVLETHSDHVLDGVRLAVREGILSPEEVAIHYFERYGLDVRVTTPVVSRTGRLDIWPEGFFDQHERNLSRLMGLPNTTG
ncbi:MAG: DUF3696 domain-containing protein [Gemmatimonadota bacterium]|nr:DUF3696 domain-containing protein [Gemmatimonadota bacterium]